MSIEVDIEKNIGKFRLRVSFFADDSVTGILGSSGCGKSMTLRCIAGVENPDKGVIKINNETCFDSAKKINLPPQKRKVGMLFQNYALFPSMTLEENLLCGIGKKTPENLKLLENLLERFQLTELRRQRPSQLSGGQQQRCALARCLAAAPAVLLLDEPFSALDAHLKNAMQLQLRTHLAKFNGSCLLVTHDRDEAYMLCDNIGIMDDGKILAVGKTKDVFRNPKTSAAARLTGCKNIVAAKKTGTHLVFVPEWNCTIKSLLEVPDKLSAIGVRAHDFIPSSGGKDNYISVRLSQITEYPFEFDAVFFAEGGGQIQWKVSKDHLDNDMLVQIPTGFTIPPDAVLLLCD